jgi:hypothetical protein
MACNTPERTEDVEVISDLQLLVQDYLHCRGWTDTSAIASSVSTEILLSAPRSILQFVEEIRMDNVVHSSEEVLDRRGGGLLALGSAHSTRVTYRNGMYGSCR